MTGPDLATTVGGLRLPNPVLTAAGCAGTGAELETFLDVAGLGGFVTRTITLDASAGRPAPRLVETPSGLLADTGLPGPGVDGFLARELPWLLHRGARVVVSISAATLGQYAELARRLGNTPGVAAVEVNLAGALRENGDRLPGSDPYLAAKVVTVVRRDLVQGVPVLAKLCADGTRIVDVAAAVRDAGADAVVVANPVTGLAIDPVTLRPALAGGTGRLSGPATRPVAVRCVWEIHRALPDLPILGVGGVRTGADALEFLAAGAAAVQVGTAVLTEPAAPDRIVAELAAELAARDIATVPAVVGRAHRPRGEDL